MYSFVLRNFTNCKIRITLFSMCVRPILKYNCTLISLFRISDLEGIENVQQAFSRHLLVHNPNIPYHERCSQLRKESLWLRRMKINLTFIFKLLNNLIHWKLSILHLFFTLIWYKEQWKPRWRSLGIGLQSIKISLRLDTQFYGTAIPPKSELAQI